MTEKEKKFLSDISSSIGLNESFTKDIKSFAEYQKDDIRSAIDNILEFTNGMSEGMYESDLKTRFAGCHNKP